MSNETELKCIDCAKFVLDTGTSAAIPVDNGMFIGRRKCSAADLAHESETCERPDEFKQIGDVMEAAPTRWQ